MRARKPLVAALAFGVFGGLVAALAMTTVMLLLRTLAGIPTPSELVGDRFAPLIPARDFGSLITWAGGYNELKQLGVLSVLVGQIVAGAIGGAIYFLLRDRQPDMGGRRAAHGGSLLRGITRRPSVPTVFLVCFVGALWLATMVVLWPVLPVSAIGLPPAVARSVTAAGLLGSFIGYGLVLALVARFLAPRHRPTEVEGPAIPQANPEATDAGLYLPRRGVLLGAAGLGLLAASGGLLRRMSDDATFAYDGLQVRGPDIDPITPNDRFYVVSKNVIDPNVDPGLWRLGFTGLVDRPMDVDLAGLRSMQAIEQETTLMCISNSVSAGLMSNAVWRGVPLRTLIEAAGPRAGVVEVLCKSVDGYSDSFSIAKALEPTTLLVTHMNGELLPRRHGFPVRLLVPGLYGEKSVKWITEVELVGEDVKGFYEQQGWGPDFVIPTRSRFDGPDFREPFKLGQPVRLHGTAFGADRGVELVEVTVDGGATWRQARLDHPGSRLTWALWSFEWRPVAAGDFRLACRATDREGNVQESRARSVVPEGARGHHVVTAMVRA